MHAFVQKKKLVKICNNECVRVFALIDSGANVSAISSKTVDKLCEAGQRCIICSIPDQKLFTANGQSLNVIGETYLRVKMAQHNLNVRVYVIHDLQQYFILGTDTMQKYKIVIDYENEQLSIKKNTNLEK